MGRYHREDPDEESDPAILSRMGLPCRIVIRIMGQAYTCTQYSLVDTTTGQCSDGTAMCKQDVGAVERICPGERCVRDDCIPRDEVALNGIGLNAKVRTKS